MRIISGGHVIRQEFNTKCDICGCEFALMGNDVQIEDANTMYARGVVKCPECGRRCCLSSSQNFDIGIRNSWY